MDSRNSRPLAVDVRRLHRVYQDSGRKFRKVPAKVALESVDLGVEQGEVHGLLGPNGAGKTTLVRILCTVLLPTSGEARVMGHDVVRETARVRSLLGVTFGGDRGLHTMLTARQTMDFWGALHGLDKKVTAARTEELLGRFGILDRADSRVETYSRGMRQRLHLARALLPDPQILFLDEPTIGMDPVGAQDFRKVVLSLKADGKTIILTTHDMAEAEAVCDRVSLIDKGRVLATEQPTQLSRWLSEYENVEVEDADAEVLARVAELPGVLAVGQLPTGAFRIQLGEDGVCSRVLRELVDAGCTQVRTTRPDLSEVYVALLEDRKIGG
ncbi:ABC transporter ATP-binding protein [Streptomyces sp. NPDC007856]|uniref:ABC transporter ATP-binding protein n=1 Tax=Streptomyces sp. NPDC007856 TaxID=3364781 RepID=UPI0036932FF2